MLCPRRMLEHILGLPDLMLFWTDDVSAIRVSRCRIIRGTLSGQHVVTFIWMIMTGGSFKIVLNWAVLTLRKQVQVHHQCMHVFAHAHSIRQPVYMLVVHAYGGVCTIRPFFSITAHFTYMC